MASGEIHLLLLVFLNVVLTILTKKAKYELLQLNCDRVWCKVRKFNNPVDFCYPAVKVLLFWIEWFSLIGFGFTMVWDWLSSLIIVLVSS